MFDNIFIEFFLKIFIFISIICVIHLLWEHLKNTYTKPKVKDLVNTQITKFIRKNVKIVPLTNGGLTKKSK